MAASTRTVARAERRLSKGRSAASMSPRPAHKNPNAVEGTITRQPVTSLGASLRPTLQASSTIAAALAVNTPTARGSRPLMR